MDEGETYEKEDGSSESREPISLSVGLHCSITCPGKRSSEEPLTIYAMQTYPKFAYTESAQDKGDRKYRTVQACTGKLLL